MSHSTVDDPIVALLRVLERQEPLLSFARLLSMFPDAFDPDAAHSITNYADAHNLCLQLRQIGVLIREESATPRYALDPNLRSHLVTLLTREECAVFQARHVAHYCELARACGTRLGRIPDPHALAQLDVEHVHLSQATRRARGQDTITVAISLCPWYLERKHHSEGRKHLERALEFDDDLAPAQRMKLWRGAGMCSLHLGDHAIALRDFRVALRLACSIDDGMVAQLRFDFATVAYYRKKFSEARNNYCSALELWRELGDRWGQGCAILGLGQVAQAEKMFADAHSRYQESATLFKETGDERRCNRVLNNVATLAYSQGDYRKAEVIYRDCLANFRRLGDSLSVCKTLFNLGSVLADQKQWEASKLYLCKCLECVCQLPRPSGRGLSLVSGLRY